jgi:hypothetical protein
MPEFVQSAELTAIAVGYRNADFIADLVLPRAGVGSAAFRFTRYEVAGAYTVPDTRVGRTSQPNTIDIRGDEASAAVEDFGLDAPLPNDDAARITTLDARGALTERLTDLVMLDREKRVAAFYADPAHYAPEYVEALSGASMFSDPASDPLDCLLAALDEPLARPTEMIMGQPVWSVLRRHPRLVKALRNDTGEGAITREQLAELLEIKAVHVGVSRVNTNRPGKAPALERVWGNFIALPFIDRSVDFSTAGVTFGLTAQWGDRVAGEIEDPDMGLRGGVRLRSGESVREVSIAPHAGYLLRNVVQS